MAELVITAVSVEEWHTLHGLANELINYTGGWVYEGYTEPWSVTLDVPQSSREELQELWRRVQEGEAPGVAYKAVQGPSYQFREWVKAAARPGRQIGPTRQMIEIKHRQTGEVILRVDGATLEEAYLAGANLDGADLARRNLCKAELQGASLINADLEGVRLNHADLRGVAMMGANLAHADLERVGLWGAWCSSVNLTGANLRGTDLRGADLQGADLFGTDFRDAKLSSVQLMFARYDSNTRWPKDFNPREHCAFHVGWFLEEQPTDSATIDEAHAVEIARRAVAANETWANRATYEATCNEDGWSVHVCRIEGYGADGEPLITCGGDRFVEIEKNGRVVRFSVGR